MKTPTLLVLVIAVGVASGAAGYYAGQNNFAATTQSAGTGRPNSGDATGANSARNDEAAKADMLASLLKGPGLPDAEALAHWAKSLSAKDCADAVKQLQGMPGGKLRDAILGAVIDSWAKTDPKGLLAVADNLTVPRLRETGVDAALKSWAMTDPKTALQWIKDNPGTGSASATQARYDAIIAGFAATDPKGAFDIVSALPDDTDHDRQIKSDALNALTDSLAEQGRFTDALQIFDPLPAGQTRDDAMDNLAKQWGANAPMDAAAWAANITDPAERIRLGSQVAGAWAASDPLAAANWAVQIDAQTDAPKDPHNPAAGPGMLLANAILAWSQDDLDGPGNFLNQLPNSPDKDRAVAVFAMHASQEDPESAVKWIGTITDKGTQNMVTMSVATQMYEQDPAMFNNFIQTSDLVSDSQRQSMQQMIPMMAGASKMMQSSSGGGDMMSGMMESMLTGKVNPATMRGMMPPRNRAPAQSTPPAAPADSEPPADNGQ
jgi:hypothetical protein